MIDKKSLKTIKLLAFGFYFISLMYSIKLMTSQVTFQDNDTLLSFRFEQFLKILEAVVIDSSEMFMAVMAAVQLKKKNYIVSGVCALLFICLFGFSITGSLGEMINVNRETIAKATLSSSEYQRNQALYDNKLSEIEQIKKQISETASNYDKQIADLPPDYITAKSKLSEQKTIELSQLNERLKSANADLSNVNQNFNNINSSIVTKVDGYNSLFENVANILNNSKYNTKTYTAETISFYYFITVVVVCELTSIVFFVLETLAEKKDIIDLREEKPNKKINIGFGNKPKTVTAEKEDGSEIKMVASPTSKNLNNSNIENTKEYSKYINVMLENTKNDDGLYKTIGYQKIGKLAEINQTQATQIYNYLKETKNVEVIGMTTCLNSIELINKYESEFKRKIGFIA